MSITNRQQTSPASSTLAPKDPDAGVELEPPRVGGRALAVLRIAFGLTFLWAFVDKIWGLGFATPPAGAWVRGGDPTYGFLAKGSSGPLASFYRSLAGQGWVTVLFMVGLLAIGLALVLGIGLRVTAVAGGLLYLMMWSAALPPTTNPVIDDHILGLLSVLVFAATDAGLVWGLGRWWRRTALVQRFPVLR